MRWKGVSAFQLMDRWDRGEDIGPFLATFRDLGFNLLRVWPYVEWPNGWDSPSPDRVVAFLRAMRDEDYKVELTLLTSEGVGRLLQASLTLQALAAAKPDNLVLEIGNEPLTNKNIDCRAAEGACQAVGCLYTSGIYEDSSKFFGQYGVAHTPRDDEWPRKAHDLLEYFNGSGPNDPSDPKHECPWVGDEPKRPDQAGYVANDFKAYAGACAILGAGATFHFESGKYARVPTPEEYECAKAFAEGLNAFPADAPLGGYRRIPEDGQPADARTYVVGERYMVRVRQRGTTAPEPGWTALDGDGILWAK